MDLLRADEMLAVHLSYKGLRFLPSKDTKINSSDNVGLEQQALPVLQEQYKYISTKRVEKYSSLSVAVWNTSKNAALVTVQVGSQWSRIGQHNNNAEIWLNAEEILYLMESSSLQLVYNNVPLSLQQAYLLLLGSSSGCSVEEFTVYANLSRLGYTVHRFNPLRDGSQENSSDEEEKDLKDSSLVKKSNSSKASVTDNCVVIKQLSCKETTTGTIKRNHADDESKRKVPHNSIIKRKKTNETTCVDVLLNTSPVDNLSGSNVPEKIICKDECEPIKIQSKKVSNWKDWKVQMQSRIKKTGKEKRMARIIKLQSCLKLLNESETFNTLYSELQNIVEDFNLKYKENFGLDCDINGFKHDNQLKSKLKLVEIDNRSLVQSDDCFSLQNVFEKLKQINKPLTDIIEIPDEKKLKISFDVFAANSRFKKTSLKSPDFRILLSNSEVTYCPRSLQELSTRFGDNVPIILAVMYKSRDVHYFQIGNISSVPDHS